MISGVVESDYIPTKYRDYRQTDRSAYAHAILDDIEQSRDGSYEVTLDERGEPFTSTYEATLFAQALRGAATRVAYRRQGIDLRVFRRGGRIYVSKRTEEETE